MKKNVLVGQSGGPPRNQCKPYGVITEMYQDTGIRLEAVYGMENGIEGFLADHVLDLSETLSKEELEILKLTPAAYLGSCRFKLPEDLSSEVYPTLFRKFEALNIGYIFLHRRK